MDTNKLLYCYAVSLSFLSPLLLLHPLLLQVDLEPILLWKGGMEDPSLDCCIIHVSMVDTFGNTNRTSISYITEGSTKRMLFSEFGTQVPVIPEIAPLVHIVVECRIWRTSKDRLVGGRWYVGQEPLVHLLPINHWVVGVDTGAGVETSNIREYVGKIGPNTAKFWVDLLYHFPPPLLLGPDWIEDTGGCYGVDGGEHGFDEPIHIIRTIAGGNNIMLQMIGSNNILLLMISGNNILLPMISGNNILLHMIGGHLVLYILHGKDYVLHVLIITGGNIILNITKTVVDGAVVVVPHQLIIVTRNI